MSCVYYLGRSIKETSCTYNHRREITIFYLTPTINPINKLDHSAITKLENRKKARETWKLTNKRK